MCYFSVGRPHIRSRHRYGGGEGKILTFREIHNAISTLSALEGAKLHCQLRWGPWPDLPPGSATVSGEPFNINPPYLYPLPTFSHLLPPIPIYLLSSNYPFSPIPTSYHYLSLAPSFSIIFPPPPTPLPCLLSHLTSPSYSAPYPTALLLTHPSFLSFSSLFVPFFIPTLPSRSSSPPFLSTPSTYPSFSTYFPSNSSTLSSSSSYFYTCYFSPPPPLPPKQTYCQVKIPKIEQLRKIGCPCWICNLTNVRSEVQGKLTKGNWMQHTTAPSRRFRNLCARIPNE